MLGAIFCLHGLYMLGLNPCSEKYVYEINFKNIQGLINAPTLTEACLKYALTHLVRAHLGNYNLLFYVRQCRTAGDYTFGKRNHL